MLQRVQTLYLLVFIALSAALISGISILEFLAEGTGINKSISLDLNTRNISLTGNLNLAGAELEAVAQEIKRSTPINIDLEDQSLSFTRFSPLLLVQGILVLLALVVMFSYKNLKKQLNFGSYFYFS